MKNTVTVVEQLLEQDAVTGVALDKLQFVGRRAPGEIVERARAQVVQDDDLVSAPAQGFRQVRPNKSRSTCYKCFQRIASARTSSFELTKSMQKLAVEGTEEGSINSNGPLMIGFHAISVEHEDAPYFEAELVASPEANAKLLTRIYASCHNVR
jgi:hypothetical protein